jgi:hypothetical protein
LFSNKEDFLPLMETTMTYEGTCFCGAVVVRVTGEPLKMGYCHCRSCRSWSAGPVNAFTLWPNANVEVIKGAEHLATFVKSERPSSRAIARIPHPSRSRTSTTQRS